MTLLIHQIQPRLTCISFLNSNHTFLVVSLETIRVVEECLEESHNVFVKELEAMKVIYRYKSRFQFVNAKYIGAAGKERLDDFLVEVIDRMVEEPWNSTLAKDAGIEVRTVTTLWRALTP